MSDDDQLRKFIHKSLKNATVKIWVENKFIGTGFFVSPDGYLLTAYHCVGDFPPEISVETRFDGKFPAVLHEDKSLRSKAFDIAVLKVSNYTPSHFLPLGIVNKIQVQEDRIVAVGYPAAYIPGKEYINVHSSTISGYCGEKIELPDAIKGKGQSGGPVYHYKTRRVIGLASSKWNEEYLTDTGLAVRFDALFQKWFELDAINKKTAELWEERLNNHFLQNTALPVSQEQLGEIKYLLGSINLKDDDLKAVCRSCVPEFSSLPACEPGNTLNYLLDWLAQLRQSGTGKAPILEFVVQLIAYAENPDIKNRIREWVKQVSQNPAFTGVKIATLSEEKKKPDQVEPSSKPLYLLIKLYSELKKSDKYKLEAWLFKGKKCVRNVYTEDEFFSLNTVPDVIEALFEKIQQELLDARNRIVIEIFLPMNLLNHDIEHWGPEDDYPIGADYAIVLRSLERLAKPRLQLRCCQYWKREILQTYSKSCSIWLDKPEKQICSKLDKGMIFFNLNFPPKQDFLEELIRSGTPILLWLRKKYSDKTEQRLRSHISKCRLEELPLLIHKIRRKMWEANQKKHLGYISVLWDDPERLPPKPGSEKNRLPGLGGNALSL